MLSKVPLLSGAAWVDKPTLKAQPRQSSCAKRAIQLEKACIIVSLHLGAASLTGMDESVYVNKLP